MGWRGTENGSFGRRDYAIVGDVVNLSARLMSKASLDTIFCDEETYKATERLIQFQTHDPIKVKGKEFRINIFQPTGRNILGRDKKLGARRISDMDRHHVIVGRDREVQLLQKLVAKLLDGRGGGFVVIEGEQGIGKSCLVESLVQHVSFNEIPYVNVDGDQVERNTPFFMWSNILNTMLADSWLDVYPRKDSSPLNSMSPKGMMFSPASTESMSPPLPTRLHDNGGIPAIPSLDKRNHSLNTLACVIDLEDDEEDEELDDLTAPKLSEADKENSLQPFSKPSVSKKPSRQVPIFTHVNGNGHSDPEGNIDDEIDTKRPSLSQHLHRLMLETPRKNETIDESEEIRNGQKRLGDRAGELTPLLVALLGQATDDSTAVSGLSSMAATKAAILQILETFVDAQNPLTLIFEDVQSMDSLSVDLLAAECDKLLPHCLFILTCRAEELSQAPHIERSMIRIKARSETTRIRLCGLNDQAISSIISHHYNARIVPPDLVGVIACKAEGNPFLCQQTAEHLKTLKIVQVVGKEVVVKSEDLRTVVGRDVPATVEQIVRSQIDALPANLQLLVKIASVLSVTCPFITIHLLTFLHPDSLSRSEIIAGMAELVKTGFVCAVDQKVAYRSRLLRVISPIEEEGETCYAFTATISHQVAYNMMLFQQRKILHTKLVELYESLLGNTRQRFGPTLHPSLALHYQKAHMWPESIAFFEKATARALSKRAARAAGELLHEILDIYDQHNDVMEYESWKIASWHRQFAVALSWNGEHERAHQHFIKGLAVLDIVVKDTSKRSSLKSMAHIHVHRKKNKDEEASARDLEAAHCFWGLYNLNVNRLHNREEGCPFVFFELF